MITRIYAPRHKAASRKCWDRIPSSASRDRSPLRRNATPTVESFIPLFSIGWCIFIRSRKTRHGSGRSIANTRTEPWGAEARIFGDLGATAEAVPFPHDLLA